MIDPSWKEQGEVPDSEDEDEDGDNESILNEGNGKDSLNGTRGDIENRSVSENYSGKVHTQKIHSQPPAAASQEPVIPPHERETTSNLNSPSPRVFRKPLSLPDLKQLSEPPQLTTQGLSQVNDEISQSYVRLSSPMSSLSSLPDLSQLLHSVEAMNNEDVRDARFGGGNGIQHSSEDRGSERYAEMLLDYADFPTTGRRLLRQRNPIQLHPYALEGETYRRTLMAHGLKPLRLTQVQEDHGGVALDNPNPGSELETNIGSPSLSVEDELHLSQSPHLPGPDEAATASSGRASATSSGDEDEFPEIGQLLDKSNGRFVQRGPKRQKTTYGSRRASHVPWRRDLSQASQWQNSSNKNGEAPGIPPSPPATSSPIPAFRALSYSGRFRHVTSTLASSRATSPEYSGPETYATTGDLPTPATNTVKHTIDLTAEGPSDEDLFASDAESRAYSTPFELDQSHVRRVGKKIKGVLPASWLRLDQQTWRLEKSKTTCQEHRSLSPIKAALSRRGVAIPKDATYEVSPRADQSNTHGHFMLEDSDEDEDSGLPGFVEESTPDLIQDSLFSQIEMDSVIEDNRIDTMAPSQKRQTKLLPGSTKRNNRLVSTSLFAKQPRGPDFQPKISDHLLKARDSNKVNQKNMLPRLRKRGVGSSRGHSRLVAPPQSHRISIPKLSILDVVKPYGEGRESLPAFIRIAARNVRSSKGFGRHSPTRKFIKLASRGDTEDVQLVLRDWREGTLRPRTEGPITQLAEAVRHPLIEISENSRSQVISGNRSESDTETGASHVPTLPRKVATSMSSVRTEPDCLAKPVPLVVGRNESIKRSVSSEYRSRAPRTTASASRPAQLETSVLEYSNRHANLAFGSTKKAIDFLYRKAHKGSKVRGDVQLARFLGDDAITANNDTSITTGEAESSKDSLTKRNEPTRPARSRKRIPRRVDAGAAVFRQPSEPLILDFLQQPLNTQEKSGNYGKLLGLGKFGTAYTHHFDIFPLQSGVFFHESTFLGSGRLSKALELSPNRCFDRIHGYYRCQIAEKQLEWGAWDNIVSSEVGVCLDWIVEQLENSTFKLLKTDSDVLTKSLTHIIDYVQTHLSFPDSSSRNDCVFRFSEVLHTFTDRLDVLARQATPDVATLRVYIELSSRIMVLIFQLLKISQSESSEIGLARRLESQLHTGARMNISLLFAIGLDPVRKLYDDLQYLTYREVGIKCDRYVVEAWVLSIHIMQAAQIPRVAFWDVVNAQLTKDDETQFSDARVLERIWYSIFSLLPLTDFDLAGVVVPGFRLRSLENWALPQKMVKKVFELYNSKSRQSPSFNDYCRVLFNRCSHLMQTWGWRRHAIIVGALFDFFATRKLAHLRNEEVYKSPSFLEELDTEPSLAVDPDDRCFHILLKIIAISIKQMRAVGDAKGIRNLVTRVLPNHDRQYPKEKTIHQRDLASLRNHHDLLCTLFWAAPPELRPSISLIRELINPESSHQEAYLINLRSWENLTRFVLVSSPTPAAYLPFATWQSESFTQLLTQHQSVEKDVEDQLQHLPTAAKQLISQQTVAHTIQENKNQVIMSLVRNLSAVEHRVKQAVNMAAVKVAFGTENSQNTLVAALGLFRYYHDTDWPIVAAALDIIRTFVTKLNQQVHVSPTHHSSPEDDSQEYGIDLFDDVEVWRLDYVGVFGEELVDSVRNVLHTALHCGVPIETSYTEKIVDTWAVMAGTLIISKTQTLPDFISDEGDLNELKMDDNNRTVRQYAPYFLGKLASIMEDKLAGQFNIQDTGRNPLSDWLCILVKPIESFRFEHVLLPIFAQCQPIVDCRAEFQRDQHRNQPALSTLAAIKSHRDDIVEYIFQNMYYATKTFGEDSKHFKEILCRVMITMKKDLCDMDPKTQEASQHERFVKKVYFLLVTYFRDLVPSDQFFDNKSNQPTDTGSHLFVATLRNYGLRLHTERGQNELIHYLLAVLKRSAVEGNLPEITKLLQEAMVPWADLSHHFLSVLTPSFIHAAFLSRPGWMLAEPLLEAAQGLLITIASLDKDGALRGAKDIMATIMKCIWHLMELPHQQHIRAPISQELVYMILLSARFMISTLDWISVAMEVNEDDKIRLADWMLCFYHFARGASAYLKAPLLHFVKTLKRHDVPLNSGDDLVKLFEAYEACARSSDSDEEERRALANLATPFLHSAADYPDLKAALKQLHDHKFSGAVWLFYDLRGSEDFCDARILQLSEADAEASEAAAVVLSDIRQNWGNLSDNRYIELRFGHEERIVPGLLGNRRSEEDIFESLLKALDEYVARYERVKSWSEEDHRIQLKLARKFEAERGVKTLEKMWIWRRGGELEWRRMSEDLGDTQDSIF